METSSDYTKCSLEELYDVQRHIDKEKYPDKYAALLQEIAKQEEQQPGSFFEARDDFWKWLFSIPNAQRSADHVLTWWEERRIPYNLIVGSVGFVSLIIFFFSIASTNILGPGEDAVEPSAIIFAPIAVNICYCAGWVIECILRAIWPNKQHLFGPFLFKLGLGFSLFAVTFPAVFWLGYRLLQLCGIIK